ncbi:bifunctional tRNA (5-methylaminomethyl-2-thiouridine)(34)-methyltransferase MnmD/FAD-dependent 5-carboxymethylaminomethyl-2-thiouridine(34) oxidoreductase MnmC [Gilvimarinus polysaccharolyticus]|uniref:bifunctional tRNA (5-methylaminomethyl-2-thiouridine)(34)-methyltransferase MnmD/FAD-dependent 5-carboxymethylaminomethyl-2-thiouridine(34) oxidoreductase MnmC n=1 Tax=Gilvimarinus polysaccharolyticus TaxID=863921 RepID=UPI000B2479BE|nr:bifunctional tRNA (5-methylaminomethyl-2-thiouridine)(34)-methyltransferase MnmD/FAD-dependent 5-carboxymethylaminomethyl-2-thiouridine(34) oxidoreductase MnmC [Gilvimarinus polysaccharolyticus]
MSDSSITSPAQLLWNERGQPLSNTYGDFYFSLHDGLAETRYVFIEGNHLPERFAALKSNTSQNLFTIAETGFGTGLNFLASWQLWREQPHGNNRLHFISVEKHPITLPDLIRALALWPELAPLATQLTQQYPAFVGRGIQRLHFSDNVSLTLIIDEATSGLQSLLWPSTDKVRDTATQASVDAWFLDGFSPNKNPDMWSDTLFNTIAALSGPTTTAATFSAASSVKRGLKAVGFNIVNLPGFKKKREMVSATMTTLTAANTPKPSMATGIYRQQATHSTNDLTALVIGAGLAGCHTARALADTGWQVTVIEQDAPASGGSGNPQGLLYARLSHRRETLPLFNLHTLMYAQRHYRQFWDNNPDAGSRCGLLQLANTAAQTTAQQQVVAALGHPNTLVQLTDADTASRISNAPLKKGGLYFPDCGWLDPRIVCKTLLDHPNINVRCGYSINELKQSQGRWYALSNHTDNVDKSVAHASIAIVACAERSAKLAQLTPLPLKPIRGQISTLAATGSSTKITTALCAQGYLAPAHKGEHSLGATFNLGERDLALNPQDHQSNLNHLSELGENLNEVFNNPKVADIAHGRAAFRCTTPDYLPIVGPVPDYQALKRDCAVLSRNAKAVIDTTPSYHSGLYVNCGHGSRGLAYTPLCAQLLSDIINRECAPLVAPLAQALHPARFALRDIIRGR